MSFSIKWSDLKTLTEDNSWNLYYIEHKDINEIIDSYIVVSGNINNQYHAKCADSDKTDFETNFKSSSTKVDLIPEAISKIEEVGKSEIVQVTPFSSNAVEFSGEGVYAVITKNTTQDVDFKVTHNSLLNGGVLQAVNAKAGDYFVAQVVDKDGVYAPAGTILKTWILKWYSLVGNIKVDLTTPQAGSIPKDVYLRIKYTSISTDTDVNLIVNYKLNKDLQ